MAMPPLREHSQRPPSFDTLFSRIPSLLLTQTSDLHLVQLSDLISIYNKAPSDNSDGLKQEIYGLRGSAWRFFYLDYDNLIKSSHLLLDCQHEPTQLSSFYKSFVFELNKVRDFCSVKGGEIDRRLAYMKNGTPNRKGMAQFIDMHDAMDELTYDIHDLWHFTKLNYRAFLGIVHFLDVTFGNLGHEQMQHSVQIETNILLQRLYRLLAPDQFLDWNLYLNWCLDLGRLYQDQLGASAAATIGNYNSTYGDNNGSSPPSPPHTLIVPQMTRDSSNASTGSLPPSTAPPSPTSTTPSHDLPTTDDIETGALDTLSREQIYRHNNGDMPRGAYDGFSLSSPSSRSSSPTDWLDNMASASLASDANKGVSPTTSVQDSVLKFWIHPDNLLEVTMYLAKYMDVMHPGQISSSSCPTATFEIDSPEHQAGYHDDPGRSQLFINNTTHANASLSDHHHSLRYWQSITTLYLDIPDMENYTSRIKGTATIGSDSDNDPSNQQTTLSTLRLRQYNNTSDSKKDTDDNKSTTHFYALEKKIYTIDTFSSATTTLTGSRTSTRSSSDSSKKLGKKPYRHHHHRHQQLRRQRSTSSTTSTTSTLSSAPSIINSDQDKGYYGNHCLHHPSSSSLGAITKPTISSIRGRIWLKSKRCRPWLKHQWSLKNVLVKSSLHHYKMNGKQHPNKKLIEQQILDMETDLHEQQLVPVLRTSFNRIGFKWTGDHTNIGVDHDQQQRDLTVTIDTDIIMVRSDEDGDQLVGKDPLQQQEYLCATQSSNDVSRFPFAVLQVKLPHDFGTLGDVKTSSLPWLNQLLSCPLLEVVQDFSLYLHGVSTHLSDKVDIRPEWHDKMELDLRQVEHQGYLSGPRRVYRLQQQRHYSNRSSRQEESTISDQNTPWSFITSSEPTTSSVKDSHSPDRALEPTEGSTRPSLHPLEDNITPTINYFTCITTTKAPTTATTTPTPTLRTENSNTHRKPSIILSPAPLSSNSIADEHTPLLPSPIASMKSGTSSFSSTQCRCSSTNQPGSSTYRGCDHCAYRQQSILSPSSSFYPSIHATPSSPHHRTMTWIQPHLAAALEWFGSKTSGKQQQQCHDYVTITIPDDTWAADLTDRRWEEALVVAKRPIPLTLLCGVGSFVVAYILYLLVSFL